MIGVDTLIAAIDAYKAAAAIERDSTLSSRIFDDGKRIGALRAGADITVGRYNTALDWLARHWPAGHEPPPELAARRRSADWADAGHG